MKYILIGITDSPHPYFPPDVLEAIRQGHVFSGGQRHHAIVSHLLPDSSRWIDITVPLDAVFEQYAQVEEDIVVFASGDPIFFGFANTIRKRLPQAEIILYPTFNSLQMLAHRLAIPYHEMQTVSLTGRPWEALDQALISDRQMIGILTDKHHTPAAIARRMLEYGYSAYQMWVGECLGNPGRERVSTLSLQEASQREFIMPNCVIVRGSHPRRFGIPDQEFELLDGRARMITKMPIRLLSLQAMNLPSRHTLWDIGFCTGSLSIEARLQFPHLQVVAFEIRPEGQRLMDINSHRHGAPGIDAHICDFLEKDVQSLPSPDAVFIGGHGGQLAAIMEKASASLLPGGCIVMNSVTAESRQQFEAAAHRLGLQLKEPTHIALNDYNPINILKCTK